MKSNAVIAPITVDRLATAEEIRAAIVPLPDLMEECNTAMLHEIAADTGGYVRIPGAEFEASLMMEELTRETQHEDTQIN